MGWLRSLGLRIVAGAVADAIRGLPGAGAAARAYEGGATIEQVCGAVAVATPDARDDDAVRLWRNTVDLLHHVPVRDVLPPAVREAVDAVADRL